MQQVTRMFVLIVIGAFCLCIVPVTQVQAVGNQTITGLPPNTVVTITFPDGTTAGDDEGEDDEGEESVLMTDENGTLIYPFPKGESTISWDGGSQVVNTPGWSTPKKAGVIGGSIAGAVAVGVVVDNNSSDNNNNPGTAPPGSVLALSIGHPITASVLNLNLNDTIPLSCMTGEALQGPDNCTISQCSTPPGNSNNHVHGNITVPALSASASEPDMNGCGHGCLVTTSNPTVICTSP